MATVKVITSFVAAFLLTACWEEQVFDNKGHPSELVASRGVFLDGKVQVNGSNFARLRELHPEDWQNINIRGLGYIIGLRIKNAHLVHWPLLKGASVRGYINIEGENISPDMWPVLRSMEQFGDVPDNGSIPNDDLVIQLTDQQLNDAFYDGLNGLLEGRRMDRIHISVAPNEIDFCKLELPQSYGGISIPLSRYPLPDNTPIIRLKPNSGLNYINTKTGQDITEKVRFHKLPWLLRENASKYLLTQMGRQKWIKMHCQEGVTKQ